MLEWLKWKIAGRELARLQRWESAWWEHDRYLCWEFPEASAVLANLKAHVDGEQLNACHPPSASANGPFTAENLRYWMRAARSRTAGVEMPSSPTHPSSSDCKQENTDVR